MQYCRRRKKSKRFSPGSYFAEQIFTGKPSGEDSARGLRQGVLITFIKTNCLLNVNLAFCLVMLAFHSYYLLFMISTLLLTVILHRMLGVYF